MASPKDIEANIDESPPPAYNTSMAQNAPVMTDSAPPNYSATVPTSDMAPPPSYDSLYGKMRAAKEESDGNMDFCKKALALLCGTIGCTIVIAVVLAIPVTMIVMGAIHKDDCPAERMIPIYLIVGGSFGILKNLGSLLQRCLNNDKEDSDERNSKTNPFDATLNCFLFAWFIAGNVWIYRTSNNWSNDPTKSNYCDETLYYFAFWLTTATYILIGTMCCCICVGGVFAAICGVAGN